ncbi:MAG: hypothetical protein AB7O56_00135 [Bauldia sp.]
MATLFRVTDRKRRAVILASAAAAAIVTASGVANAADIIQYTPPPPTAAPIPVTPAAVPSFYLNVSALYMTRKNPAETALIIQDDGEDTGAVLLDASDLNYNWRPGIQVRAGAGFGGGNLGFEIGGFWLAPMTAEVVTTLEPVDALIQTNPETILAGLGTVDAFGTTTFRGLDANLTYAVTDGISVFGGVALMSLHDTLELTVGVEQGGINEYVWDVHNRLIGPQVGANISVMGGGQGLFVDATVRAGLMFNQITSTVESPAGEGDNIEKVRGLMLGGGVTAGYNFNENFGVTLGYQATLLRNVGLATDQVGVTGNLDQPGIPLETATGKFLAHGLTLGLNLAF